MKITANDFSEKDIIRILREWTGLTQREFGESIGKSEAVIQTYEQGIRNYSFKTLQKIAKIHGITITFEKK